MDTIKWQVDFSAVRLPDALATLVPLPQGATLQDFADFYEKALLNEYLFMRGKK